MSSGPGVNASSRPFLISCGSSMDSRYFSIRTSFGCCRPMVSFILKYRCAITSFTSSSTYGDSLTLMYAFAAVRTSAGSSLPCACISSILVFISSSVSTSSSSLKLSAASSRVCWSLVASSNASQMVSSTDASRARSSRLLSASLSSLPASSRSPLSAARSSAVTVLPPRGEDDVPPLAASARTSASSLNRMNWKNSVVNSARRLVTIPSHMSSSLDWTSSSSAACCITLSLVPCSRRSTRDTLSISSGSSSSAARTFSRAKKPSLSCGHCSLDARRPSQSSSLRFRKIFARLSYISGDLDDGSEALSVLVDSVEASSLALAAAAVRRNEARVGRTRGVVTRAAAPTALLEDEHVHVRVVTVARAAVGAAIALDSGGRRARHSP